MNGILPTRPSLHRFVFICLLLFHLLGCLRGETVRVATFNVRNYLSADRWVEGRWRMDYPKPEREKAALREIILRISPDVLALQEMGSADYLAELQADLRVEGLDFPYAELLVGPDEDRHLAVLSKVPPAQVLTHDRITFRYFDEEIPVKRGLQELVFETAGQRWSLFNVHLKSRWTDREDDPLSAKRRVGEAQAVRDFIRQRMPAGEASPSYLVAGDFNDQRDSSAVRRFLTVSDTELTHLVPCTDSRGEAWTFHYQKRDLYERVDFILASPPMLPLVRSGGGTIVDILPESTVASDHRMVYVDLDFPDSRTSQK